MILWNDFTHFLDDPVNGDQEEQTETRTVTGGQLAAVFGRMLGTIENETEVGLQLRYDSAYVDRQHTRYRTPLDYCSVPQVDGPALQVAPPAASAMPIRCICWT